MQCAFWVVLGAVAVLWPSRISGPLDGIPLDQPAEVLIFGIGLPFLVLVSRSTLRRRAVRAAILVLIAWKAFGAAALVQDGWCVRFETPAPLYRDMGMVPHSWDARADWRSPEPRCSAIVDRPYAALEEFPIWFYNLPPNNNQPATDADRPPLVTLRMFVSGALAAAESGMLRIETGADMQTQVAVDGVDRAADGDADLPIAAGVHDVTVTAQIQGGQWRFAPSWNGDPLWPQSIATVDRPSALDLMLRPGGRIVPLAIVFTLMVIATMDLARLVGASNVWLPAVGMALFAAIGRISGPVRRAAPALLALAAWWVPRRLQTTRGFMLLVGAPWLTWFGVRAAREAGVITLYTSGDDWWMFQRYAYRIFLQGFWLEGGQPTFWYQPLYRWIAGTLHMIFGDSSAGELLWDAWGVLAGAAFAFVVTRHLAAFRWAIAASVGTLVVFTLGPAWYLFGRGLSELSSMAFLHAAALLLLYNRRGHAGALVLAGVLGVLAFYTRLNNLLAVLALAAFALPLSVPIGDVWRPRAWLGRLSKPALAATLATIALGLWLFAGRTYYYTGIPDMLHGTQAGPLMSWQHTTEGLSPVENISGSVLMVLSMNDPPRLDPRALPLVVGVAAAILGLFGVPLFRRLPLNVVVFCLAGMAGSLIARGSAYPGRFSVHLIPSAVTLAVCAVFLFSRKRATGKGTPA